MRDEENEQPPHPEQRAEDVGFWASSGALAAGLRKRGWASVPREQRVQVRFTADEHAEVRALAHRLGLAPGSWIALLALAYARGQLDPIPPDWHRVLAELMRLRSEVEQVGRLLNQVARHAHRRGFLAADAERVLGNLEVVLERLSTLEHEALQRFSHHR